MESRMRPDDQKPGNFAAMDQGDPMSAGKRTTHWGAVEYSTSAGDRVVARRCRLPTDFADQLDKDLDGLRQRATEETAALGAALIDADRVAVAGRSAFRRVERLPMEDLPGIRYAATLIVVLGDELGVEVTVTSSALNGTHPADARDQVLARVWKLIEKITSMIRLPDQRV
jgi:hypothetical protein